MLFFVLIRGYHHQFHVQLQNTMLANSRPGRMREVYIVVKVFLSDKCFSLARMFNFLPALSLIVVMWPFHERFVLNSTPRCLCLTTVSNIILLKERGNLMLQLAIKVPFEDNCEALLSLALNLTPPIY